MLCETMLGGRGEWWVLATSHYLLRLMAGECCVHTLLAIVSHSLSKWSVTQLYILTVFISFLNMCYMVMCVVLIWMYCWHLFCKHSLIKLWQYIDPWERGVQFSLALNSGPSTSTSLVQGLKSCATMPSALGFFHFVTWGKWIICIP